MNNCYIEARTYVVTNKYLLTAGALEISVDPLSRRLASSMHSCLLPSKLLSKFKKSDDHSFLMFVRNEYTVENKYIQ